jgi:uncharacterized protein (DUF927 family)
LEEIKYTKKDFLETSEPYKEIYKLKDDKLRMKQQLEVMSDLAKEVGVANFKTLFKEYEKMQVRNTNVVYGSSFTSFEGQQELECGEWIADDSGITKQTDKGVLLACSHPILPVERITNIDTGIEKLKIAFKRGNKWRYVIEDKKTISSANNIINLANAGIGVTSETAKYLVSFLHDLEAYNYNKIPEKNSVSRLGWIDEHGFSPYVNDLQFDGDAHFKAFFESVSEKGDFIKWVKLAKKIRTNGVTARIILAGSFASVLIKKIGGLPFFVHLWGGTEVGKTVGLMLAASVWSDPEVGRYIHTFNSTAVGREKSITFVNSMPLILDELQIQKEQKSFDKDIYQLTEGAGRTRGTKTGGIDKVGTWCNCILTSGEMPITNSNSGGGATNRIIEIECKDKLFEDAKEVADTVKKNYGFAGSIFVEWLKIEKNVEHAKVLFEKYVTVLEKNDTTEKQTMAMAMLLTADEIITDILFIDGNNIKVNEIVQFLQSKSQVSANSRAYEHIVEYIISNKKKYFNDDDKATETWGVIDEQYYYIMRSKFNSICNEAGFNSKSLLSWLKQENKIEFLNGLTKNKRINGSSVPCVWLKREKEEEEEVEILDF